MLLVIAATEFEMSSFRTSSQLLDEQVITAVSGVGPLEASVRMMRLLGNCPVLPSAVINFGIGGAYQSLQPDGGPSILDICFAERECLGDYGVCYGSRVEPFQESLWSAQYEFSLDERLLAHGQTALVEERIDYFTGTFVTVNGASGTAERGALLRDRFSGLCENMEGAAIARVCREYSLPLLEVRAISNLVEDRPGARWQLEEACERAALSASIIIKRLSDRL